jgi:hypothetical protein
MSLGRLDGDTCLVELLPLPSPSVEGWLYGLHSQLPYLADRNTYYQACLEPRIEHLKLRINTHEPEVVIFYGLSYQEHWQAIAEVDFSPVLNGVSIARNRSTLFVMTRHPAARGVTNEYFHHIGKMISTAVTSKGS